MATDHTYGGYEQERFVDEVHSRFECPICFKIFKDPVQCPYEHYFCRSCIERCLLSSNKCPQCQCDLVSETFTDIPRIVTEMLEDLDIRCKNANRGCPEVVKLQFLQRHEENCGYSPTPCRNEGCDEVLNKNEIEEHERERCKFRVITCEKCQMTFDVNSMRSHPCFMRQEIDELTKKLNMIQNQLNITKDHVINNEMQVKLTRNEMVFLAVETSKRCNFLTGKTKIFVCGGFDGESNLDTVESFNWDLNCWQQEPKMKGKRFAGAAFVHGRDIFVSGGWNGERFLANMESLNVDGKSEWKMCNIIMEIQCRGHSIVYHDNSAITSGGVVSYDPVHVSDAIYSLQLNPPHTTKLLVHMPEPRCNHGTLIIDNEVLVIGGRTSSLVTDIKNTVYSFSLSEKECKTLAPLPYPLSNMGIVSYRGNAVLIGGLNDKGEILDKVSMYDVKTGQTKMLPSLNHKRCACSAVIVGNVIVVVGGCDDESFLDSVECLDMTTNVWRELPPMLTKRSCPAAVVSPIY
ncbi:kelch-like protein 18 [Xenia sp. Carnegie-2017]|uniref:kelch-like protein 18 n=1 Tax=Xenia sp. Carnegie-2017 TaxID=2897299 RepID=UPI001F03963C|nr:kelch-like protein 18 [Xenia sp. Carnegie-2017]